MHTPSVAPDADTQSQERGSVDPPRRAGAGWSRTQSAHHQGPKSSRTAGLARNRRPFGIWTKHPPLPLEWAPRMECALARCESTAPSGTAFI